MKRMSVLAAMAGWTLFVGGETARAEPPGNSWQLVFADEFDISLGRDLVLHRQCPIASVDK